MDGFRKVSVAACGLSLTALVLAGCSSSSKHLATNSSSSTAAGSEAQAPTGAPITVGAICDCSGAIGPVIVDTSKVYQAWVNTVNAAGGINGHPVKLELMDDASNPATGESDAQTLISDHVDAIVALTYFASSWESAVDAAHIPVVGGEVPSIPMYTDPNFYPEGETQDSSTYALVATAKAAGATNLGTLYCTESSTCSSAATGLKQAGQQAGLPVTYSAAVSQTAVDYTAQCVAAKQQHISAIAGLTAAESLAGMATNCATQGYKPIYLVQGDSFTNEFLTTPGTKDNLWSAFPDRPFWSNNPEVQAMNAAVNKYYPGLESNTTSWSQDSANSWASGLLLEAAVKAGGLTASGTPSSAEVIQGLTSLKGETLGGWSPPLTFPAGKPHPIDCWFTAHVSNGVPVLTNNGSVSCSNS